MKISELHDQLYSMMCMVDDICQKEGVNYYLDSGTAIGAAREKGFIPWDDDVDLKVLREDYPAFKDAMIRNLPEGFRFVEPVDFAPHFYDTTIRIVNLNVAQRNETDEDRFYGNLQNRICLDVFVFEKVPDSAFARRRIEFETKMYYGMAMSKRYAIKGEKYTLAQKIATTVLRLMGKPFSVEWILKRWEKAARRYEHSNSAYRFPANYILSDLRFFPESIYSGTVRLPFRDRMLPMPSGYDAELTLLYGDYMHPPKDKSIYITHVDLD